MAYQLGLFAVTAGPDALLRVLDLDPPEEQPDGGIRCNWRIRRPTKYHDGISLAWAVLPCLPGCHAYDMGARWFYGCESFSRMAHGSGGSSGPWKGDRDSAILRAQMALLQREARILVSRVHTRRLEVQLGYRLEEGA